MSEDYLSPGPKHRIEGVWMATGTYKDLLEAAKNGLGYAKSAQAISVYAINDVTKIQLAIEKAEGRE